MTLVAVDASGKQTDGWTDRERKKEGETGEEMVREREKERRVAHTPLYDEIQSLVLNRRRRESAATRHDTAHRASASHSELSPFSFHPSFRD